MASGNTRDIGLQLTESTSGNTDRVDGTVLPLEFAAAIASYQRALRAAPLAAATRAKYVSRVRGYLAWLATTAGGDLGDPREETAARCGEYRCPVTAGLRPDGGQHQDHRSCTAQPSEVV